MTPVLLSGRLGGTTHREVELLASLPPELRLIGGLAVMCRVGSPHRTTVDLDAVARDLTGLHESIARMAVTASGGGQYRFEGALDLDVIDVAPQTIDELVEHLVATGEPLTDLELNIVSLTWAHDGATPLDVDRRRRGHRRATRRGARPTGRDDLGPGRDEGDRDPAAGLDPTREAGLGPVRPVPPPARTGPGGSDARRDARRARRGGASPARRPGSSTTPAATAPSARSDGSTSHRSTSTTSRTP